MLNWKGFGRKRLWPNGGSTVVVCWCPCRDSNRKPRPLPLRHPARSLPTRRSPHNYDEFELRSFWLCNFLRSPSVRVAWLNSLWQRVAGVVSLDPDKNVALTSFTALSAPVHLAGHPYGQSPRNEWLCNNPDHWYSEGPACPTGTCRGSVIGIGEEEFNIVMFWQLAALKMETVCSYNTSITSHVRCSSAEYRAHVNTCSM
jgi:hypothetical protein